MWDRASGIGNTETCRTGEQAPTIWKTGRHGHCLEDQERNAPSGSKSRAGNLAVLLLWEHYGPHVVDVLYLWQDEGQFEMSFATPFAASWAPEFCLVQCDGSGRDTGVMIIFELMGASCAA